MMMRALTVLGIVFLAGVYQLVVPLLSQSQGEGPGVFKAHRGLVLSNPGAWKAIQRGIELRTASLERLEPHQVIDLKLVRLEQRRTTMRILYGEELGFKSADARTFAARSGAIAVINASYFDERGRPLGLLKTRRSRPHSSLSRSSLFTGVFGVRNDAAFVMHRDELILDGIDEAIQTGPLLLAKGIPLTITRGAGRQRRRSLIGIDKDQRVIIAVTDTFVGGLSWVELQEFFDTKIGLVQTPDLLNLDGGGSAQLYLKGATLEEHIPGTTAVPVAIGFFHKQN
jgi:exopolysaccharide biosynthesis protein